MSLSLPLPPTASSRRTVLAVLAVGLLVACVVAAGVGQLNIPAREVFGSVLHKIGLDWGTLPSHPQGEATLWQVRFPRLVMAAVVGAAPLPRTEVVSKLWAYIKKNKLQDAVNKRMINADAKLKEIFGKMQVSMFEMAGLIGKHLK